MNFQLRKMIFLAVAAEIRKAFSCFLGKLVTYVILPGKESD